MKTKHGQRVPPELQNDNSKWVKLFVCFDKIVEFSTRNITLRFGTFKIGYKPYVASSYHKRINLTNESYVGQLINIMGPPIPGRGVPRIDVFFAGNDLYF